MNLGERGDKNTGVKYQTFSRSEVDKLIQSLMAAGNVEEAEQLWRKDLEAAEAEAMALAQQRLSSTTPLSSLSLIHPIHFRSTGSYVVARTTLSGPFSIFFQFRTVQSGGLLLFAGRLPVGRSATSTSSPGGDFIAVELVNGVIRYVFGAMGDIDETSAPHVVRANVRESLADDEWHEVSILRPTLSQHILRVDDTARSDNLPGAGVFRLGRDNGWTRLFVGGLPDSKYGVLPRQIKSRRGFHGCLASVDIDGDKRSLLVAGERPTEFIDDIVAGCQGIISTEGLSLGSLYVVFSCARHLHTTFVLHTTCVSQRQFLNLFKVKRLSVYISVYVCWSIGLSKFMYVHGIGRRCRPVSGRRDGVVLRLAHMTSTFRR